MKVARCWDFKYYYHTETMNLLSFNNPAQCAIILVPYCSKFGKSEAVLKIKPRQYLPMATFDFKQK